MSTPPLPVDGTNGMAVTLFTRMDGTNTGTATGHVIVSKGTPAATAVRSDETTEN